MSADRTALAMPDLDGLDDFTPRPKSQEPDRSPKAVKKAVDKASSFPSREASKEAQLNIKGPEEMIERFKTMCKDDRRSYYAMLEILMDNFEGKGQGG